MEFAFDPEKNKRLYTSRGVTFPMVIEAIHDREVFYTYEQPNQAKYPGQKVLVVELGGYAYCVPYVDQGDTWFLKTIHPNRRFKYLIEGNKNG